MKKFISVIAVILLLFLTGCVSEEDYNDLQDKNSELEARLVIIEEELSILKNYDNTLLEARITSIEEELSIWENYDDTLLEARITSIEEELALLESVDVILEYDSFNTIDDYAYIQTQEEDQYLVYWYSETCYHCTIIKTDILEFAYANEAGIKVYFMDAATTIGTNYIAGLVGTPSMIIVVDGIIVDLVAGSVSVPELLEAINNGTYSNIN